MSGGRVPEQGGARPAGSGKPHAEPRKSAGGGKPDPQTRQPAGRDKSAGDTRGTPPGGIQAPDTFQPAGGGRPATEAHPPARRDKPASDARKPASGGVQPATETRRPATEAPEPAGGGRPEAGPPTSLTAGTGRAPGTRRPATGGKPAAGGGQPAPEVRKPAGTGRPSQTRNPAGGASSERAGRGRPASKTRKPAPGTPTPGDAAGRTPRTGKPAGTSAAAGQVAPADAPPRDTAGAPAPRVGRARAREGSPPPGGPVIVVGGGAAGMMAAISAARHGAPVLVLERLQRVGKKILATGNGRCNYTNVDQDLRHYHGADPNFAVPSFREFDLARTLAFFEELGIVPWVEEENGKLFPASQQASAVLDVLRYEMDELGVEVVCEANTSQVVRQGPGFRCVCTDGRTFDGRRVVLTAGGKAAPALGTDGGGFRIAAALGHHIERVFPTLVQVTLDAPYLAHLAGVRFDGEVRALLDGNLRRAERGEILFTAYGASGPPVYQVSRIASEFGEQGRVEFQFDLFPDASAEEVGQTISRRFATNPRKSAEFSFVGLLNKKLIAVILREAGVSDVERPCGGLAPDEVARIAAVLKSWHFRCTGTQSWMHCESTAGGVSVREVNPHTLESRLVPGLYLAGEVLDVDGDLGGYNFQWAWSSGWVAGRNAAS